MLEAWVAELFWDSVHGRVAGGTFSLTLGHLGLELLHFHLGLARLASFRLGQKALDVAQTTLSPGCQRRWLATDLVRLSLLAVVMVRGQGDVGRRMVVSCHVQVADLGRVVARVHILQRGGLDSLRDVDDLDLMLADI